MQGLEKLESIHIDTLREVANIGAGHSATALSQLTNRRVNIGVPDVTIAPLSEVPELLGGHDEQVAAVMVRVLGDVEGRAVLVLPRADAKSFCDVLLGRVSQDDNFDDMERSTVAEVGNILASAYINAIASVFDIKMLITAPSLELNTRGAVLAPSFLELADDIQEVICVTTDLGCDEAKGKFRGHFLVFPDASFVETIIEIGNKYK